MVPHLVTALTGPINELEQRIIDSMPATERWFRLEWMEHTPPFYTSVDIRALYAFKRLAWWPYSVAMRRVNVLFTRALRPAPRR